MTRTSLKTLTLSCATALTLLGASPAYALFGGGANCASPITVKNAHNGTRDVVRQEHETTRDAIISAIEDQTVDLKDKMEDTTQRIIEAMALAAGENTAGLQRQTEASRRIADAQALNDTDRLRQEIRARAESGAFDPNPFSCQLLDMFEASRGSGAPVTGAGITRDAVNRITGQDENVRAGGARVARSIVDARDRFAGFQGSENATTDWSFVLNDPTIDLSDPDTQEVISWIISNAISATPERAMTEEELTTPEGMARAAVAQERISRQQAALSSIEMSLNMRTPVHTDDGTYRAMADDSGYSGVRNVPDRLSELQMLDIRTVNHYAPGRNRLLGTGENDPGLEGLTEKGWLWEIHRIMSINARINYIRLELENRNAITNALILAALSES